MDFKKLKSYRIDKLTEKAEHFYKNKLNEWLKSGLKGKFAAIDPDTGESFVGQTTLEVIHKAHEVNSNKLYHIVKIGYRTSAALK